MSLFDLILFELKSEVVIQHRLAVQSLIPSVVSLLPSYIKRKEWEDLTSFPVWLYIRSDDSACVTCMREGAKLFKHAGFNGTDPIIL